MGKPEQGGVGLLDDEAAQALLSSTVPAHLAYTWTDGTPRNTPIWFHWDGAGLVMCSPSNAPKVGVLSTGAPVAVTIHGAEWPFACCSCAERLRSTTSTASRPSTARAQLATSERSRATPGAPHCRTTSRWNASGWSRRGSVCSTSTRCAGCPAPSPADTPRDPRGAPPRACGVSSAWATRSVPPVNSV